MPGHGAAQVVGQPPRRLSYILPESQVIGKLDEDTGESMTRAKIRLW